MGEGTSKLRDTSWGGMATFFSKRWFILAVVAGCTLAWFWPAAMAWTRWAQPRLVMPLALLLTAVTMDGRSLLEVLRRPAAALWAVVISYTVLPALGYLAGQLLPSDFRVGLMICCSAPCTLASAVLWTRLAGGHEATALLSTFISTGVSWLTTTTWLAIGTGQQIPFEPPAMMRDLALTLIVPVAIGQLVRAVPVVPPLVLARKTALGLCSRVLVLVILLRAAHEVAQQLHGRAADIGLAPLVLTALVCVVSHLLALVLGWWSGARFGFARGKRIAVAFAGSQKTLPVSLVILDLYFPGAPLAVVPMLFYHAGQLSLDTLVADRWAADVDRNGDAGRETC